MKKKLIVALTAITAAICGAFGFSACGDKDDGGESGGEHIHNYKWIDNGDGTHKQHCQNDGCDAPDKDAGSHNYGESGVCICGANKPAPKEYTVIFDCNGGKFDKDSEEIEEGVMSSDGSTLTVTVKNAAQLSEPLTVPERSGSFAFSGWSEDKDGNTLFDFENSAVSSDIKLYAVWSITFDFKLSENKSYYSVRGLGGLSGDVVIPETHNNKPVKEILSNAFKNESRITGIVIPDSVTKIGDSAFCRANNLLSVSIGEGVTELGEYLFAECSKLEKLTLPKSLKKISSYVFGESNETDIEEVHYGGTIDDWCVIDMDCSSSSKANPLASGKSVLYIDGVAQTDITVNCETVNSYAFFQYNSLNNVTVGKNVKTIGNNAFSNCRLSSLNFENGATLTTIGYEAFNNNSFTQIILPNSVITVGESAFKGCNECVKIDLGGAKYVLASAFESADSLTDLNLRSVEEIGKNAFFCGVDDGVLENVTIPDTVWYLGGGCFTGKSINSITLQCSNTTKWNAVWIENGYQQKSDTFDTKTLNTTSNGLDRLMSATMQRVYGELTFSSNGDGYTVTGVSNKGKGVLIIPEQYNNKNVTAISYSAFNSCDALKGISVPRYVSNIETNFKSCASLRSISVNVNNSSYGSNGTILFRKSEGEIVWISPNLKESREIVIPEGVKKIDDEAFKNFEKLEFVTLPDSLTSIGKGAFENCALKSGIIIPDNVVSIGERAFAGNNGILTVYIPNSVTSIGSGVFDGCTGITDIYTDDGNENFGIENGIMYNKIDGAFVWITPEALADGNIIIPDGVTKIGDNAFDGCDTVKSVVIPDSVTEIGNLAFKGCTGLTEITIPDSVTKIGGGVFYGCTGLEKVVLSKHITQLSYYRKKGSSGWDYLGFFEGCVNLTDVNIPDNVTTIGAYAFYKCSSLTSVTIPDSVTSIGGSAFSGCEKLIEDVDGVKYVKNWIIGGDKYAKAVTLRQGSKGIADNAFAVTGYGNSSSLTEVSFPDSLISIGSAAFKGCDKIEEITLPDGVVYIGEEAFYGCTALTQINIPAKVKSIGKSAFYNCKNLTGMALPNGVTSIGDSAFSGCEKLTSINVPDSVTSIGDMAFGWCSSLTSLTIPENTSVGNDAFYACYALTVYCEAKGSGSLGGIYSVVWNCNNNVKDTEGYSYAIKDGIRYRIKDGVIAVARQPLSLSGDLAIYSGADFKVTEIVDLAFNNCSSLTGLSIPDSVKKIGQAAFSGCRSLESITLPNGLDTIRENLFSGCIALTSVTIPNSVTSIGQIAFSSCSSLESITIPDSVTTIGNIAFYQCKNLVIYCEAKSKPSGWSSNWQDNCTVIWDCKNV